MSIETFDRILWVVLDGFGHEHARRLLDVPGRFPALERVARDGYLGACRPPGPVCQTPPALLALFSGTEPAENGVWGYKVPDAGGRLERSISGFSVARRGGRAIWEDLEDRGLTFSLMNVSFRQDRVWSSPFRHLAFAYDGYRCLRPPVHLEGLGAGGSTSLEYRGMEFSFTRRDGRSVLRKGNRMLAGLEVGEGVPVAFSRGTRAFAHQLSRDVLSLYPESPALVRLGPGASRVLSPPPGAESSRDLSAFRKARAANGSGDPRRRVTVESELLPARVALRQKADLMLWTARTHPSALSICYVPLIDEFNHTYFDLIEGPSPDPRASELLEKCWGLVDAFLADLMRLADPGTLLVLSSDHGALPFRRLLHLNELFADEGLVQRDGRGYDLGRSAVYYHPSDCGQVVVNGPEGGRRRLGRPTLLAAARAVVERANDSYGAHIGAIEGGPSDPYLLYLYPLADAYFTGNPCSPGRPPMNCGKAGGHHLSPLTPNPWIEAVLGLWSPRPGPRDGDGVPLCNTGVKEFLLGRLAS